jgi:hypothetical protein
MKNNMHILNVLIHISIAASLVCSEPTHSDRKILDQCQWLAVINTYLSPPTQVFNLKCAITANQRTVYKNRGKAH